MNSRKYIFNFAEFDNLDFDEQEELTTVMKYRDYDYFKSEIENPNVDIIPLNRSDISFPEIEHVRLDD